MPQSKTTTNFVVSQYLLLTVHQIVIISLITYEDIAGVMGNIDHIADFL
jgi:hypothetical protein